MQDIKEALKKNAELKGKVWEEIHQQNKELKELLGLLHDTKEIQPPEPETPEPMPHFVPVTQPTKRKGYVKPLGAKRWTDLERTQLVNLAKTRTVDYKKFGEIFRRTPTAIENQLRKLHAKGAIDMYKLDYKKNMLSVKKGRVLQRNFRHGQHRWTEQEMQRLKELVAQKYANRTITDILNREFPDVKFRTKQVSVMKWKVLRGKKQPNGVFNRLFPK